MVIIGMGQLGVVDGCGDLVECGQQQQVFLGEEIAQGKDYSEETAREVDVVVKTTLTDAYERASSVLKEHREALDRLAEALLEKEELTGEEAMEVMGFDGQG